MATTKAHRGEPIWVTEGGAELPITNIAAATALVVVGPGNYSLDRAFGLRLPAWLTPLGLAAVIITVLYAGTDTPNRPSRTRPARAPRATLKGTRKANTFLKRSPRAI